MTHVVCHQCLAWLPRRSWQTKQQVLRTHRILHHGLAVADRRHKA